jgi:hypothetical protein
MAKIQTNYFEIFTLKPNDMYLSLKQDNNVWCEGIFNPTKQTSTKGLVEFEIDLMIQDLYLLRLKLSETHPGSDKVLSTKTSARRETRNNKSKKVSHTAQKLSKINKTGAKKKHRSPSK